MPIEITTKKEGFRRAGVEHCGTQVYDDGHFTAEQLEQLKSEAMLVVREVPAAASEAASAVAKGKGKDASGS